MKKLSRRRLITSTIAFTVLITASLVLTNFRIIGVIFACIGGYILGVISVEIKESIHSLQEGLRRLDEKERNG